MKFFYFLILILISSNSLAHECILNGTSAKEITIYNSCKARSQSVQKTYYIIRFKQKLITKFKSKNLQRSKSITLRNQLLDVKIRLNTLMSIS